MFFFFFGGGSYSFMCYIVHLIVCYSSSNSQIEGEKKLSYLQPWNHLRCVLCVQLGSTSLCQLCWSESFHDSRIVSLLVSVVLMYSYHHYIYFEALWRLTSVSRNSAGDKGSKRHKRLNRTLFDNGDNGINNTGDFFSA